MKCNEDDTIADVKKLLAAQIGTRWEKIRIQKWCTRGKGKPFCGAGPPEVLVNTALGT